MALDPNIALGIRPLEVPNQLAQYSQLAQIQNAQNQNALAQYQLGSAQRAEKLQNLTSDAYSQSIDPATGQVNYNTLIGKLAAGGGGSQIPGIEKTRKEIETAALQQQKLKTELATARTAQFRDQLSKINSPEAAAQWTIGMYNDPYLKDTISSVPLEAALAEIPKTPDAFNVWKNQNALGMTKFIELNKPTTFAQDTGSGGRVMSFPGLGGPATVVPGSEFTKSMTFADRNAAARLAFDQNKFAYEKANPGFELKQAEDGSIVGVNKRTLQAFPVMLEATTPAPQTGAGGPANMLGQQTPMAPLKGKDASKTAVSEQQASYNLGRVLTAASQINEIGKKDPDAVKPGGAEALAASIGMGGTANLARNANRQIVFGAQRDALDALLYLATGAAYNKEQLEGQMAAYIPSFTDKPETVTAKKARMTELIKSAKTRAGKAWTPEMDAAMNTLTVPTAEPAPGASQGTGGFKYLGKESTK